MRVASKFNERYKNEKCPKCSEVFVNFMVIDENMLGCYKCGTVFVKKSVRDKEYARVKEQLAVQMKEKEPKVAEKAPTEDEAETFKCDVCGKLCKSKLGLLAHMRSHKTDG